MKDMKIKSLNFPDEKVLLEREEIDIAKFNGFSVKRLICSPGWSWEKHLKPISKSNSCQSIHILYVVSGQMQVVMVNDNDDDYSYNHDDNQRRKQIKKIIPNDIVLIPPGHREWVVGDSLFVAIDFAEAKIPRNNDEFIHEIEEKAKEEEKVVKFKTSSDTEC
jgi:mannose-6-phosphate isomerase-like protein (cupin superfamily)